MYNQIHENHKLHLHQTKLHHELAASRARRELRESGRDEAERTRAVRRAARPRLAFYRVMAHLITAAGH